MRKTLPFLLLGIAVILAFSIGILYFRLLRPPTTEKAEPSGGTRVAGEVVVTHPDPVPNEKELKKSILLSSLKVESLNLDTTEVKGEKRIIATLVVSFKYQGEERKLAIPIVDNIALIEATEQGFEEAGQIHVAELNLEKGAPVSVAFSYISKEAIVEKADLVKLCEARGLELCLSYIELGFGDKPVDFDIYLDGLLTTEGAQQFGVSLLDYTVAYPNTIIQKKAR